MLFFTLLTLEAKPATVPELRSWAVDTLRQRPVYVSQGAAGLPADWIPKSNYVPPVFEYLNAGCDRPWDKLMLEQIGKAFRMWRGREPTMTSTLGGSSATRRRTRRRSGRSDDCPSRRFSSPPS
eukprot:5111989-Prymnesium_polylepis.1